MLTWNVNWLVLYKQTNVNNNLILFNNSSCFASGSECLGRKWMQVLLL